MQLKLITAAIASMAVGSALAGPIPQPLDVDDALALFARAEQAEQAQQAQQAQQAAQAQQGQQGAQADQAHQAQQGVQGEQAKQGEQGKQGDQWLFPGGINAGVSYNGLGYGSAYFNGLGINAYARGYGYGPLYGGYGGYGRRGWNRWNRWGGW